MIISELSPIPADVRTLMVRHPFDDSTSVREPSMLVEPAGASSWLLTLHLRDQIVYAFGPAAVEICGWLPSKSYHHEQTVCRHELAFLSSELPGVLERARTNGYCVVAR